MSVAASRFLEPKILAEIKDLQLLARTVVEGFLAGEHPDPRPGAGVEFHQYRSYQPGDDPRRVDWGVYARSDRFYIREAEVERDITVRILLDATASMGHRDGELTKLEYAKFLVAALAYLVDRQGDRVAFHAIHDRGSEDLPAQLRRRPLLGILDALERLEPSGEWPSWELLGPRVANQRERELAVVVSDLHQAGDEIEQAVKTLTAIGHEVIVLHLLGRNELDFAFSGDLVFEDLETGQTVRGNAAAMRSNYLSRLQRDLQDWTDRLAAIGVPHEVLVLDQPLDLALRAFLLRRRRLP